MSKRSEQVAEADKIIPLLNECRGHLDTAMYRMGDMDDDLYRKCRTAYDLICKVLDLT